MREESRLREGEGWREEDRRKEPEDKSDRGRGAEQGGAGIWRRRRKRRREEGREELKEGVET